MACFREKWRKHMRKVETFIFEALVTPRNTGEVPSTNMMTQCKEQNANTVRTRIRNTIYVIFWPCELDQNVCSLSIDKPAQLTQEKGAGNIFKRV